MGRNRSSPSTFLVFSDTITGMIGVLLVVLVIARPPAERPTRLEQADLAATCVQETTVGSRPSALLLPEAGGDPIDLESLLERSAAQGVMSLRIAVLQSSVPAQSERDCIAALQSAVEAGNDRYDTAGLGQEAIDRPYVFLTLRPGEAGGVR
jgi:hypothetical protein